MIICDGTVEKITTGPTTQSIFREQDLLVNSAEHYWKAFSHP